LERARTAIRSLKQSPGLPVGGVVVWLRGGIYPRIATFTLVTEDSGTAAKPVVYRGYPGEQARLVGGQLIDPRWFTTVTNSSPAWPRMDPAARGRLLQVDLAARGITDYGRLTVRGFGASSTAAMELFFNQAPMTLARWPDPNENDKPASFTDDAITIYGTLVPDVTGSYVKSGSQDGVNAYVRQGLVGGKQYNLHRRTWVFEGI
jgi:hypothetical protein